MYAVQVTLLMVDCSYDSDYFLVLVGVSRPLYDIIFLFSDRTLYSYYFVLSCRHMCTILYGFCVEYSVLLSLGRINMSCFLFPVSCIRVLMTAGFAIGLHEDRMRFVWLGYIRKQ